MKYRTVLFDLDGTLIDSSTGILNGYRYALEKLGIVADDRLVNKDLIGPPLRSCFAERFGVPDEQIEHAIELYREYYRPVGALECNLYPDVMNSLRDLHAAGIRLWLATSKAQVFAQKILEHFAIAEMFDGIVGSELDGSREGKQEVIEYILQHLPEDAHPVLMVGDRHLDAAGAQAAGVDMAAAYWGFGSASEFEGYSAVQAGFESLRLLCNWILGRQV